jgi:hypothetical protein
MFFPSNGAAAPPETTLVENVFLILSHAVFLPLIGFLLWYKEHYMAGAIFAVFVFSDFYHFNLANVYDFGLSLYDARRLDYITAIHAFAALILVVILYDRGGKAQMLTRTLLPFIVTYAVLTHPFEPQGLVIVFFGVLPIVIAYKYLIESAMIPPDTRRFGWRHLSLALFFAAVGLSMYFLPVAYYGWSHAIWHLALAPATFFATLGLTRGLNRWTCRRTGCCCGAREEDTELRMTLVTA